MTVINQFRPLTRGNYDTDFSNLKEGCEFPSNEVKARNQVYRYNKKLFTGEYAYNKKLIARVNNKDAEIEYKTLPLNYFELIVNKLDSLFFSNEITITTGNVETDNIVNKLVEKTGWTKSIRQGIKLAEIYGDSCIKTYRGGASAFAPTFAYKVVDISDKSKVIGYVMHELLYDTSKSINGTKDYIPRYIRILISCKGFDYERVYEYQGTNISGTIGKPVRYKYKSRWIPRKGRYYFTGIEDAETLQWISVNIEKDGVYGSSSFESVKDLIFAIEERLSTENYVIDAHGKPLLIVGMSALKTDEQTGEYHLSVVNGKYMVAHGGDEGKPEYLTWDGKLEASKQVRDDLMSTFYELSEMGKTFLSGEYQGNISEESLNNIIKSAIDRGNREVNDFWYEIRKSLYILCRLNDININIENINISFNIGRVDDTKTISEISEMLINMGLFSKETILKKFWGYSEMDAKAEFDRIKEESEGRNNDNTRLSETVIRI